jgi:hypothetical protein
MSSGFGHLYEAQSPESSVAIINYQLTETDATQYTKKRWWGEFSMGEALRHSGNYIIDFEDRRRGDCLVSANTNGIRKGQIFFYRFNGRGQLNRR